MLFMIRLFTLILFFSLTVEAKIDIFMTKKLDMPQNPQTPSAIANVSNKVVNSIDPTDSSNMVVNKIIDNSVMYWWDNSGIKNTRMGQAVETAQNKMRADVNLGSTGNDSSQNETQHKLSLRVLAAQALAKIEYFGWFKAAFKYDMKNSVAETEVYENLANNKDLVVSHAVSRDEAKSQVSFRWNW
jgi:hypothetical protein